MRYDKFREILQTYKEDFLRVHGREMETLADLEEYLKQKKIRSIGRRNLTTLKGFGI